MQPDRLAVFSVVGLVTFVTVATGPHLALLSIPEGGLGGGATPGSGSANLTVLSAPDSATLEAEEYGEVHYLRVPETTVAVSAVTGAPLLTLSIDIPALGFRRSSVFTVGKTGGQTRTFGVERVAIESDRLDQSTYEGTLLIVLRNDDGRTVLYEDDVTVEVEG